MKKDIIKETPLKLKEKDLCKLFYHRVRVLQDLKQFPFEFFIFHIANEQYTSRGYTMELIRMGLRSGVADYCILIPGGRVAFLEFKRDSKCKLSEKQESFQKQCLWLEIPYGVSWDVDKAIEWIYSLNSTS